MINSQSLPRLVDLIQMLPWASEADFIHQEFINLITSTARYGDITDVAVLLYMLKKETKTHNFVVSLMDAVFEEILRAIERNDFKESQQRISVVKFVAEAYNHKLLHTDNLFDLLYKLINYDIVFRQSD